MMVYGWFASSYTIYSAKGRNKTLFSRGTLFSLRFVVLSHFLPYSGHTFIKPINMFFPFSFSTFPPLNYIFYFASFSYRFALFISQCSLHNNFYEWMLTKISNRKLGFINLFHHSCILEFCHCLHFFLTSLLMFSRNYIIEDFL